MDSMFNGCSQLISIGVSKFNTQNVEYMDFMFKSCSNLTSIDVSKFNTRNVSSMYYIFTDCSNLTSIDVSELNINFFIKIVNEKSIKYEKMIIYVLKSKNNLLILF